ncbi:hypothetical protein ACQP2Y_21895 [Actinoplanes sp. CA-051413]|uniref:hypothetical protein n=1 Tax=Actinoplanes sp. CA-051413 TaxID=3239899 RepID=UPI003D999C32
MTAPLDLDAISAEFLTQCGSCDAGVSVICTCAGRDYRPTMITLVREVERYRDTLEDLAKDCEAFPEGHTWAAIMTATAVRLRLILAGERP